MFDELKRRNVFRVGAAYVVIGWVAAQVAEFAFENFGAPEWVLKAVVVVLLIGLPIALLLAWAFELTPEGIKREEDVHREDSITNETGRKINHLIMAGLVVAVGLLVVDRFLNTPGSDSEPAVAEDYRGEVTMTADDRSIAVLPFVAMSDAKEDEFFADGLSEELLNVLSKIDDLKVAGRTSSFYYKGRNEDLRQIADALGVEHILEGSVRRSGDRLRVTAQLIKADDGFHLWSEAYDRPSGDVFAIQDEIARNVADALQAELLGDLPMARAPATVAAPNAEAQNLYLIAQAALADRGLQNVRRARDLYAQASTLEPNNPRHLAGYAQAVAVQYWNFRDIGPDEAIYEASNAINRALELGEPSADTLAIAGLVEELRAITANSPEAKDKALRYYQEALDVEPNNILALQWLASIYLDINESELARQNFEEVIDLDPLNLLALTGLANAYSALGRYEDGREHLYRVQMLFPELAMAKRYLSGNEYQSGRLDRSTYWAERAVETQASPLEILFLLGNYLIFGWSDEALETAERYRVSTDGEDVSRMVQALLDREFGEVADEASKLFAQTGDNGFANLSAWSHAINGQCATAVPVLERQYPSLRAEVINYIDRGDLINAVLLAHCYGVTGNAAESRRLIQALIASGLLDEQKSFGRPQIALVRIAALAVAGESSRALEELERIDSESAPVAIAPIPLPVDELPVFASLFDAEAFKDYARTERYRIAQQARRLAAGETLTEVRADVEAAGYTLVD